MGGTGVGAMRGAILVDNRGWEKLRWEERG